MNNEELIETLRAFEKERVENLNDAARNLFYAIMKIADERDYYRSRIEKAIEYIKDEYYRRDDNKFLGEVEIDGLLKILEGNNE